MIGGRFHVRMNVPYPLDRIWYRIVLLAHVVVLPWLEPGCGIGQGGWLLYQYYNSFVVVASNLFVDVPSSPLSSFHGGHKR
jgi:hypothetical protein